MVKTAIVILNWNGIKYLKKFLPDVYNRSADKDTRLFLADNGSSDDSVRWVTDNLGDIEIILLEKNHGFAEGYNLALEKIDAEYFVLLNSDIEVPGGWLKPLVSFMDRNPDVASCQPKILSYNRKTHFEYAGAAGGYIDRFGYPLCRGRIFNIVEEDKGQYDSETSIFWSTGACMIVRSVAWKNCRGFDPAFFAHMEEIDLCWRFHKAGYRVAFIPESHVYHVGGGALPYDSPFKTYLNFRNSLFLLYKNIPDEHFKRTFLLRMILDGMAALFFLIKGQFKSVKAVYKAHRDFYRELPALREKRKMVKCTDVRKIKDLVLNKSIAFEFYIRGHKAFKSLKPHFKDK